MSDRLTSQLAVVSLCEELERVVVTLQEHMEKIVDLNLMFELQEDRDVEDGLRGHIARLQRDIAVVRDH